MEFLTDYDKQYWDALLPWIGNEMGVAALMGNLEGESNCIPYRLEGDMTTGYTKSIAYTNAVDNGTTSESSFVGDGQGYGVAQWTFSSRKQQLYNLWKSGGYESIGSFALSVAMLKTELENSYADVLQVLQNTNDIRTASDYVLKNFENPDDQSETVQEQRYEWAVGFYNKYSGTIPTPTKRKKMNWIFYMRPDRRWYR